MLLAGLIASTLQQADPIPCTAVDLSKEMKAICSVV